MLFLWYQNWPAPNYDARIIISSQVSIHNSTPSEKIYWFDLDWIHKLIWNNIFKWSDHEKVWFWVESHYTNRATSIYLVVAGVESRPDELRSLCRGQGNCQKGDRVQEPHRWGLKSQKVGRQSRGDCMSDFVRGAVTRPCHWSVIQWLQLIVTAGIVTNCLQPFLPTNMDPKCQFYTAKSSVFVTFCYCDNFLWS